MNKDIKPVVPIKKELGREEVLAIVRNEIKESKKARPLEELIGKRVIVRAEGYKPLEGVLSDLNERFLMLTDVYYYMVNSQEYKLYSPNLHEISSGKMENGIKIEKSKAPYYDVTINLSKINDIYTYDGVFNRK